MAKRPLDPSKLRLDTRIALAGRDPARHERAVNPAVHHATTVVIDDVADLYNTPKKTYALEGMAIQEALCDALIAIEGGAGATLAPSGLAACTLALLTVARADHDVLVTDSVYGPTRRFCDTMLKRLGVRIRYFDPRIGAGIADLLTDQTCAVFMESPGSLTFEIQDVRAIASAARARGAASIIDNTWSAGVFFKPFDHGVDLSVQALTKYQSGHADAFMGAVLSRTSEWATRVRTTYKQLGLGAAPDDAYLVLRGLRSLHVRLERQAQTGLALARWLEQRSEVARVIHPALESHPDHALWKRDFSGAAGVFAVVLKQTDDARVKAMLESLAIFSMGFSWGGYESLVVPCDPQITRTAASWRAEGPLIRLSVGLEHLDDLIEDLAAAFAHLA